MTILYYNADDFRRKVKDLSDGEIDAQIAEISLDITFLEIQLKAEPEAYSYEALKNAEMRINGMKEQLEILKAEINERASRGLSEETR